MREKSRGRKEGHEDMQALRHPFNDKPESLPNQWSCLLPNWSDSLSSGGHNMQCWLTPASPVSSDCHVTVM